MRASAAGREHEELKLPDANYTNVRSADLPFWMGCRRANLLTPQAPPR